MKKTAYRYHFFQGRIFVVFSFQKGRYFTVYKRNQRHWEPQTLCVFVDAKACSSSGFVSLLLPFTWKLCTHVKISPNKSVHSLSLSSNVQVGFGVIVYVFDRGSRSHWDASFVLSDQDKQQNGLETVLLRQWTCYLSVQTSPPSSPTPTPHSHTAHITHLNLFTFYTP